MIVQNQQWVVAMAFVFSQGEENEGAICTVQYAKAD